MNCSVFVTGEGIGLLFKENRDGCLKNRGRIWGRGGVRCQRLESVIAKREKREANEIEQRFVKWEGFGGKRN